MPDHSSSRMVELVYGRLNDATYQEAVTALPTLPDSGSKWVADKGSPGRKPGQMRQSHLPKFQQLKVPEVGIEPTTRGFSVPFPPRTPALSSPTYALSQHLSDAFGPVPGRPCAPPSP